MPYSDADAFAQTDIRQEYVTQLPLIEQSPDQTTTWHSAVQDIPIVQSTQPPPAHAFISSSPTGNRDLEAASSMLPLITLSPDYSNILVDLHDSPGSIPSLTKSGPPGVWATEAGDSASMEKNLLHLGIPWFSGEVKDVGDPEPELNMRFPPLSTQQVVNSGIKEQEDEFDEPTILDVSFAIPSGAEVRYSDTRMSKHGRRTSR